MHILITNDDGVHAPGIMELAHAFAERAEVTVVGPEYEQSGVSHAITFLNPIFVNELDSGHPRVRRFAASGSPSDCTKLGILELCGERPDFVVSGINGGLNIGINCLYSGTLAGAREAALFEIPAFAVSIDVVHKGVHDSNHLRCAARYSRELIFKLMGTEIPAGCYFNINYPIVTLEQPEETTEVDAETPEMMVVPMETRRIDYSFEKGTDPAGRPYYWMAHTAKNIAHRDMTDLIAIQKGHATVTPMMYDLTDFSLVEKTRACIAQT